MARDMICRICGKESSIFAEFEKVAANVSVLYNARTLDDGKPTSLYYCKNCNHYQMEQKLPDTYYDNYVMTTTFSQKMQTLQKKQAAFLFNLAYRNDSFVDIGCGDGNFLLHIQNHFTKVVGIEPSKPFAKMAESKGFQIINAYLSEGLKIKDILFNAFSARQVFEHVVNPVHLLKLIFTLLDDEAVGLIEVPNAQKIMNENRYFDIFLDHVNYFTPLSLCCLAEKASLKVFTLRESFGRDYLELYVKKIARHSSFKGKAISDIGFIKRNIVNFEKIAAWGAGAKAHSIMVLIGRELNLKYIFDSDPNKRNKYVPNSNAMVMKPSSKLINEVNLIIIFAVSYQDEILKELKEKYNFKGTAMIFETEPSLVNLG